MYNLDIRCCSFLFVFLIIFKLLSAIEKIEQNISEITRKESLHDVHERIEKLRQEIKEKKTPLA